MKSQRLFQWGILVCSVVASACGDNSSATGAGGSLGKGGGIGTGGGQGSGGIAGYGGILGAGGSLVTGGNVGTGQGGATGKLDGGAVDTTADVPADAADDVAIDGASVDGGAVRLPELKALIAGRCAACHTGIGTAATRLDLTDNSDAGTTLYARLLGPVLLEAYCGENIDAGGDAAVARRAIVPGDLASSFLYLKITGTQPSPGNPPANCGSRMPRVFVPGVDGGAATFPSCDSLDGGAAANCLSAAEIDLVRQWILEGAPAD